ncbi:MAG TPA: GNAT family N-acetyltransferase [Streptomyces sp.]
MNEIVRAWVEGWVASRGAASPVSEPWGVTVEVGRPDQVRRHVFGAIGEGVEEAAVRKVAEGVRGYGVWLKVFHDPEKVGPWLGPGWWIDPEPGYLMTTPLTPAPLPTPPTGYTAHTWTHSPVTRTLLSAPDGSFAASGQVAVTGTTAVFDQIGTSPTHRRRGLATAVMRTLHSTASTQAAHTGILAATPAGRALYETLGWQTVATLTSAKFQGEGRD